MFNNIKKIFNRSPTGTRFELITTDGNGFFAWNGNIYKSDIIRACMRPRTKAIGKAVAKHIRSDEEKGTLKINPDPYMRILLQEPNPYMTWQMMIEKTDNQLQLNNNAFIFIYRDENGYPQGLYPITAHNVYARYDKIGQLCLEFLLKNGRTVTFPYTDIIHLRDDFMDNDIFGTSPMEALKPVMEIVNTTDQGIVRAVKNGAVIKWLLKFKTVTKPEDMKKNAKEFVQSYMDTENEFAGAAAADMKYDAIQVDPKDYVPNAAQMDRTIKRVYSFFNSNEKIVESKYNENEWNAYYENVIEPRLQQYGDVLSIKLFTRHERAFGNSIILETSNLQYASMTTKLALSAMVDRGAMLPNEWRKTMGKAPIEGGDKPIRRLDTAEVNKEGGERTNDD